jgi:DNA-binding response OmpR family regulator
MSKQSILVVDDEQHVRELLKRILEEEYDVILANNGKEALEKFKGKKPDLIISDIRMPEIDGLQLLQNIREESNIPVIVLTGVNDPDTVIKAFSLETDDYVRKPFSKRELLLRVNNKLRRTSNEVSS